MTPPIDLWASWVEAEFAVAGWRCVRHLHDRALPDLVAVKDGTMVLVWIRPESRPALTKTQLPYALECFPDPPTPTDPVTRTGPLIGALTVPTADSKSMIRDLAEGTP